MEELNLNRSFSMLFKTVFLAALATIYLSILFSYPEKSDLGVIMTNFVIVIYSTYRSFFFVRYNYSIYQFFYIFSLFFMGMAPLVQYKQSTQAVNGYDITDGTYFITNIILIIVFVLIDFLYNYRHRKKPRTSFAAKVPTKAKREWRDTLTLRFMLLMVSSISLVYILYINQQDPMGLFYRDIFIERTEISDSMINILAGALRPLSIFAFIFYYNIGRSKTLKILLFSMATITCFPLALTRFLVGAYWTPVILTIFRSLNTKKIFGYLYALGLLIIFPMFEIFRAFSVYIEQGITMSTFLNKASEAFSSITYDTYQSLAFVIQNHFVTYGGQLLGVLGLFIPRSIWDSKPVGSGFTISNHFNLGFDNISMNFFGEGYVNFGIIGIFIFAAILAITMRYFDSKYWVDKKLNGLLFPQIYLIILGIFAYIMRGDMMGSFTSTIATIISATVVYAIVSTTRMRVSRKS